MKLKLSLPFTIPAFSRSTSWRVIASTLLVLLIVLLVTDALIFVQYGIGWSAGVETQQFTPVSLNEAQLDEATRVVGRREDVRATKDYGLRPKNIFE